MPKGKGGRPGDLITLADMLERVRKARKTGVLEIPYPEKLSTFLDMLDTLEKAGCQESAEHKNLPDLLKTKLLRSVDRLHEME